jgi:tRNA A37 threonylcarbamoyladenosine biosynthesis protein TsaE
VEWSENVADALEEPLQITIEKTGEESRRITIEGGDFLADFSL